MAPIPSTNVLFVAYKPSSSGPTSFVEEPGITQHKHAALEYHRRVKFQRLARPNAPTQLPKGSKGSIHIRQLQSSSHRPLLPRNNTSPSDDDELPKSSLAILDLGAGQLDPFNVAVPGGQPHYVLEMLDHAASQQWAVFSTSKTKASLANIKHAVFSSAMISPASFYTIIFAGATHNAFAHTGMDVPRENKMLRLSYKFQAIKAVNEEIKGLKGEPSDDLLLSMVTLAAHGNGEQLEPLRNATKSPLASAQNFDYYGNIRWELAHYHAITPLIERKGGLPAVKIPGLANAIELSGIFISFIRLSRPTFPLLTPTSLVMSSWPYPKAPLSAGHNDLCKGFDFLPSTFTSSSLFSMIQTIRTITIGFSMYTVRHPQAPSLAHIVWARNSISHDLLSLPPAAMDMPLDPETAIYEAIRCSVLAYVLLVLFPIPVFSGSHIKVATSLLTALDDCNQLDLCDEWPGLLLWSSLLGGMLGHHDGGEDPGSRPSTEADQGAITLTSRFVKMITKADVKHKPSAWGLVRDICSRFLWFEGEECEGVGKSFWNLACESILPEKAYGGTGNVLF
ncbi:hypothetical protein LTR67_006291 [Exophiala xenobiotica]